MDNRTKLWYLENFSLMRVLPLDELMTLESKFITTKYQKGDTIYKQNDKAEYIYFVKQGSVKIAKYDAMSQKDYIITVLKHAEVFGELSIIDSNLFRDEYAEAMEYSLICKLSLNDFNNILKKYPEIGLEVSKSVGKMLITYRTRLEDVFFKTAEERIISFLRDCYLKGDKRSTIKLKLTHEEIGKLTANSRQTVTTILRRLEMNQFITYKRNTVEVLNDALFSH